MEMQKCNNAEMQKSKIYLLKKYKIDNSDFKEQHLRIIYINH